MTDQRELDRLLGALLVEGTDELADRVIDAALDQIDHTRQRRAIRMPRRFSTTIVPARIAVVAVIGVLAVGGGFYLTRPGQPAVGGPGPAPTVTSSPSTAASPSDKLHQQAQAALARWADAVAGAGGQQGVVLVGELTGQVGNWELAVGDNNKAALYAGLVEAAVSLPAETGVEGEVRWQDGATEMVRVISAQQAVAEIKAGDAGACPECVSLRITGARLTTGSVETSRGPATAPIWEFTVQGTTVKVTRVAIADRITVVPPPWNADDAPVGISVDSASGTVGGRELTVAFVGAPLPGDQGCGADYSAEAVESPTAVVVIVTEHPHGAFEACTAVGARRTASVELAAPLGARAVLEVQQGLPVPVVLTP